MHDENKISLILGIIKALVIFVFRILFIVPMLMATVVIAMVGGKKRTIGIMLLECIRQPFRALSDAFHGISSEVSEYNRNRPYSPPEPNNVIPQPSGVTDMGNSSSMYDRMSADSSGYNNSSGNNQGAPNGTPPRPQPPSYNNDDSNTVKVVAIVAVISVVLIIGGIKLVDILKQKNDDPPSSSSVITEPVTQENTVPPTESYTEPPYNETTADTTITTEPPVITEIFTETPPLQAEPIRFYDALRDAYSSSVHESMTVDNKFYEYNAWKVTDRDPATCWCEGKSDDGLNESITLVFDKTYLINQISLMNGLCADEELFYKNSRVRTITVSFSNGESFDYDCQDGWNNRQNTITLNRGVEASSITITVKSVYQGRNYNDTCISEISLS